MAISDNPFSDLIPGDRAGGAASVMPRAAPVTTHPAATPTTGGTNAGLIPLADRGIRPKITDFRKADGTLDTAAYTAALNAWKTGGTAPAAGGTTTPTPTATPTPAPSATPAPAGASPSASALNNFANSAGMQFQLQQGADMIQNLYAAKGALQSGSAMKALQDYGQKTALNNYFMPYMSLLGGQQAVGAGAASSIAGVGSSFGNAVTGINGNLANGVGSVLGNLGNATQNINAGMGSAYGNLGNANAQNAYNQGAANAGMWGTIGGALGNVAGSIVNPMGNIGLSSY